MTDKDVTALKKLYQCGGGDNNVVKPVTEVTDKGNGGNGGLIGGRSTIYPPLPDFPGIRPINPSIRPVWPTDYPWPKDDNSTPMPSSIATSSFPTTSSTTTATPVTEVSLKVVTDIHPGVSVAQPDGSILTPPPPGSILPDPPMPGPLPPFNPSSMSSPEYVENSKSQKMKTELSNK